jgi:hypothetical protein
MERLIAASAHHVPVLHVAIVLAVIASIALVYAVRSRKRGAKQSDRDQGRGA